jgi:hypothetical protein
MGIALEKRLRKLEKAEEAKMDKLRVDHEAVMRREAYEKLSSTPQSRAVLRAYWEQRLRAKRAEERKGIEAATAPERLPELRKEWSKQDAQSKAREEEYLRKANIAAEDAESVLCRMIERP